MTNGEKIQKDFKGCEVCEPIVEDDIIHVIFADKKDSAIGFDWSWWNAEYKEPTTKNDLALIHTEGLDEEIRCTMCTNYMKSDRGCDGSCVVDKDMYKAVMDAIEKRIQPTTKNDLSSELEKNSKKLEKDFGELDCISRIEVIDYLCKHCPDDGECFKDCDEIKHLRQIPSVTPIRPKGHWINKHHLFESCSAECSSCHKSSNGYMHDNGFSLECKYYDFCPNCGADNREVEE